MDFVAFLTRELWHSVLKLQRRRGFRNAATLGLVVLGPMLAIGTYVVIGPLEQGANATSLRAILLADLIYVLVVAALVMGQVARLIAARRAKSAGSQLHLRLTWVFALLALIPTVTVAVFASITINFGLEGWFSDRVRQVVGASLAAAQSYEADQRDALREDTRNFAIALQRGRRSDPFLSDSEILTQIQASTQRGLREAFLIDGLGTLRGRGENSYLFDFEAPTDLQIEQARAEGLILIDDWAQNELRALYRLDAYVDKFLYLSREVDGDLLLLLDETRENVQLYQQLESERGQLLFQFALLYLGFAVILFLAAIWVGLWFAEGLSGPVGRLTGAAQQVGAGNLDVQVREEDGDDEIAMLGRFFNQMTRQLKAQRETLLENTDQIERRRRLFDSVLTSVTSGVVGLDPEGRVTFVNRSALRLLDWSEDRQALDIAVAVPEFGPLFNDLRSGSGRVAQREVKVTRAGRLENLLVRMSTRRTEEGLLEGYVVAFDDVTDLVSAQRMAAWGDVARRIAHEIKNPLTPIQLSAERIKRKFSRQLGDDKAVLEQMTDVIVRQTGDLRRIVDEFSKFARMPEPKRRTHNLSQLVRESVELQRSGQPDVDIALSLPEADIWESIDATMIGQALTNLMKNAGEAIETRREKNLSDNSDPRIEVEMVSVENDCIITITDNGVGLPVDRSRLFEPYVTTRNAGTGLGLPIVKKIVEEHGGTLILEDAPQTETNHTGARAVIVLPRGLAEENHQGAA